MSKTLRLALNLLLAFVLLAGSSVPAQAAAPSQTGSPSPEPPPQRVSLDPRQGLHAPSAALPSQASVAWKNPIPDTCVVNSQFVNPAHLNFDLYVLTSPSGQYQPVFNSPVDEIEPRFNAGCTAIVYTSAPPSPEKEDLYRINPDGSGLRRLTQNQGNNYNGAWSHDDSKIAFTSDRDGQPEIYVMNADGSGQTRLTFSGGDANHNYDGMPAWSPDGTKIAFVSNRTGGYRIWTMSPNGSNLYRVSDSAYSFHPQWSPDGTRLLYDAAFNWIGVAFQRLFTINANGTYNTPVTTGTPYAATADENSAGWSPDGSFMYYSLVSWTYNNTAWYWDTALDYYLPVSGGSRVQLSPGTADWFPSWETYDNMVPIVTFNPVPAVSPAPLHLSWTVQDISLYNMTFLIQYTDMDKNGRVTSLLYGTGPSVTSLTLNAAGGHTYSFKIQATDGFGHSSAWTDGFQVVTRIEDLPPVSTMAPLPTYTLGTVVQLNWSAVDPGGSGIYFFDVQSRDAQSSTWSNLVTTTTQTAATFTGALGHTYNFRVHALDNAENEEYWTPTTPFASTTLIATSLTGALYDAAGLPIPGVTPGLNTPSFVNLPSRPDGRYGAYFLNLPLSETVTWSKPGYGAQAPFYFNLSTSQQADVYLPPADDVIVNGGFENGSLSPADWTPSGDIWPTVISNPVHSGHAAVQLGTPPNLDQPVKLNTPAARFAVDASNVVHVVSSSNGDQYNYTRRETNGSWSAKQPLPGVNPSTYQVVAVAVDSSSTVNVVFTTANNIVLLQLPLNGSWSAPFILPTAGFNTLNAMMEPDGRWHFAWIQPIDPSNSAVTAAQFAGGEWLPAETVAAFPVTTQNLDVKMALGPAGQTGLAVTAWDATFPYLGHLCFTYQSGDGPWSPLAEISSATRNKRLSVDLAISPAGVTSVAWSTNTNQIQSEFTDIYYSQAAPGGGWSTPVQLNNLPIDYTVTPHIAIAADETVYVAYQFLLQNNGYAHLGDGIYVLKRDPAGVWTQPRHLQASTNFCLGNNFDIAIDVHSQLHIVWSEKTNIIALTLAKDLTYIADHSIWNGSNGIYLSQLIVGPNQVTHVLWYDKPYDPFIQSFYYSGLRTSQDASDSEISQTVTLPPLANHPGLSFLYQVWADPAGGDDLSAQVTLAGVTTQVFSATWATSGWTHAWIDLSPWAGQTVTLTFRVHDAPGFSGSLAYLDEISVGSTFPDAWVHPAPAAFALPGSQVTVPITLGNQARVPAAGASLTLTLPAGLTFVSASIAPTSTDPALTWDLGDLAAQSTTTLWVTLQVDSAAPTFTPLAYTAALALTAPELETTNNTAPGVVNTNLQVYLPMLKK